MRGALAVLVLVAIAPFAAGQSAPAGGSTPTTLYFHVFDTFNKFPINTQPMDVAFFDVGGTNFPTVADQGFDFNTIYGYSTAGPVEYDFIENGRPRFHPEHGIARDVLLDSAVAPTAYIYLDVRDLFGGDSLPNGLPSLTVRVTMREGDQLGDEAALDQGKVIMSGQFSAHVWDATLCVDGSCPASANSALGGQTAPDGLPVVVPDAEGIVEFAIPMTLESEVIPRTEAYNVRIDWWQNPANAVGEDEFSTGYLRLVADQAHLPRVELAVRNPIAIDFIHPQVAAGILLVHAAVASPWGTYDVDMDNVTLEVDGPSKPVKLDRVVAQHAHIHGMHDQAAEVTWMWRFRDEGAANGAYTLRLTVPNLQGTAVAEGSAGFRVEGKRAFGVDEAGEVIEPVETNALNESPLPAALGALAAFGVAALGRRRWGA